MSDNKVSTPNEIIRERVRERESKSETQKSSFFIV